MNSPSQVVAGVVVVLVGVVMLAFFGQSATGIGIAVAALLGGLLFAVAGIRESVRLSDRRVEDRHLVAAGSALVALSLLPSVADSLVAPREAADLFWGVTMLVALVSLLALAVMHATGRFEGEPSR